MDASASPKVDLDINVCGFFVQLENAKFRPNMKQNNTIIKYTKLPDFDYDPKAPWTRQKYTSPSYRRIISIDDHMTASQSLKSELGIPFDVLSPAPFKVVSSSFTKRKIVTITEDDEKDLHPQCTRDTRRSSATNKTHRAVAADFSSRDPSQRVTTRLSPAPKYSKIQENSAKSTLRNSNKDLLKSKTNSRSRNTNLSVSPTKSLKTGNVKEVRDPKTKLSVNDSTISVKPSEVDEKETTKKTMCETSTMSKLSVNKYYNSTRDSDRRLILNKNKLIDNLTSPKKSIDMSQAHKTTLQKSYEKSKNLRKFAINKNQPVIVHVPLEEDREKIHEKEESEISSTKSKSVVKVHCSTETVTNSKDMNVGTDPRPEMLNKLTEIELETICTRGSQIKTDMLKETFDSLDIPNFTLTKEKSEIPKDDIVNFSQSLPNLKVPALQVTTQACEKNSKDKKVRTSASYIIGRATLTYTTRQKINIHVVGNNNDTAPHLSSSPLAYPMNIVSVFKNEIKNSEINDVTALDNTQKEEDMCKAQYSNCLNEIKSLNWSCVFDSSKLVKPSEIISTIRLNNGLLQSDYICEQFQRELNFIDSFFESLQYLESCSLTDKCFTDNKVENWVSNSGFNVKTPEYDSFFSKLENGAISDDSETMASKSLCLLNLLIRDEQRRAKNLLFVLKMREDALKDFTKSQILWLENKKKQENTDISTLKKKQRGALLKLQHECGEMQRMRKALLALSEKRKVALMKTKKNIELKLKNNVSVDHIILGKKLKRNTASDRNTAPLKCFDLSSSGCDESTTSRAKSETVPIAEATPTRCVEKCIQTGESLLGSCVDQSTDTAAENFVGVDGGYLNILFHNLSLPQIFSSGKQYEVNEEALRNIVNSSNSHCKMNETDVIEKFIEQIKNDADVSSTPSTARSLVEELDQYYKGLAEEKSPTASPEHNSEVTYVDEACEVEQELRSISTMAVEGDKVLVEQGCECDRLGASRPAGPLPVPAGEAADSDDPVLPLFLPTSSTSTGTFSSSIESSTTSQSVCPSMSMSSLTSPAHGEAEELRRQQLAIEREIKALEQQQCQLLVVREIPDKPPPPYTPPTEIRAPKPPPMFLPDDTVEQKILNVIAQTNEPSTHEAFDVFITDFCQEMIEKQKSEESDRPWDTCNLLPQKAPTDVNKLVSKTSTELKNLLTGVTPTVVSGVGARRSDHIDDILFAEWRRCEHEWTALHTDEAGVKNQIFESIFQKILTETVDEYKKTVLHNQLTTG